MPVVAKAIYQDGGHSIRPFFRGFGVCILRSVPVNAVQFLVCVVPSPRIPTSMHLTSSLAH